MIGNVANIIVRDATVYAFRDRSFYYRDPALFGITGAFPCLMDNPLYVLHV